MKKPRAPRLYVPEACSVANPMVSSTSTPRGVAAISSSSETRARFEIKVVRPDAAAGRVPGAGGTRICARSRYRRETSRSVPALEDRRPPRRHAFAVERRTAEPPGHASVVDDRHGSLPMRSPMRPINHELPDGDVGGRNRGEDVVEQRPPQCRVRRSPERASSAACARRTDRRRDAPRVVATASSPSSSLEIARRRAVVRDSLVPRRRARPARSSGPRASRRTTAENPAEFAIAVTPNWRRCSATRSSLQCADRQRESGARAPAHPRLSRRRRAWRCPGS